MTGIYEAVAIGAIIFGGLAVNDLLNGRYPFVDRYLPGRAPFDRAIRRVSDETQMPEPILRTYCMEEMRKRLAGLSNEEKKKARRIGIEI